MTYLDSALTAALTRIARADRPPGMLGYGGGIISIVRHRTQPCGMAFKAARTVRSQPIQMASVITKRRNPRHMEASSSR